MLKNIHLKLLNSVQRRLVLKQWKKHQHGDLEVDYDISGEGDVLKKFLIRKGVWDFLKASGRYHARYMFYHNKDLFAGKTVIDIGTGSGIIGIVMAKCGAKKVIMSDISEKAVENATENISRFGYTKIATALQSNLFENIPEKADCITWMIPFFPGTSPAGDTISTSMIMEPSLLEKFLREAKSHLKKDGVVVICSYSLGGDLTNPEIVAAKAGYHVKTTWQHESINGLQRGMLYMHELRLP